MVCMAGTDALFSQKTPKPQSKTKENLVASIKDDPAIAFSCSDF